MFRKLLFGTVLGLTALPGLADHLMRKSSPHSVTETVDRLEKAVNAAGANVFARVDHAAGAQSVGMELPEAQVLIFGNPKLSTVAMQADLTAGLDLPMRVLVMEDWVGTELVYHAPASLARHFAIPADAEVLTKMTGAIDMLTGKAGAED